MDEKVWAAVIGAAFGFLGGIAKGWLESRERTDQSIRDNRFKLYQPLWRLTVAVPEWPRNLNLTGDELNALSKRLRAWYFGAKAEDAAEEKEGGEKKEDLPGGMFLSEDARYAYGEAQEALQTAVRKHGSKKIDSATDDYDLVRTPLSRLRTELTRDLLSRRRDLWTSLKTGWRHLKGN